MRNISFALTTRQIRERSKDVTRRMGWLHLKAGDRLQACEKCMGRKKGEPLIRLCVIEVVSVRREPLCLLTAIEKDQKGPISNYGREEVRREGFPDILPQSFVSFFCDSHKGCDEFSEITRIEFKYV